MDKSVAAQLVRTYIDGWKEYDTVKILSVLDPEFVLVEMDGQVFRGAERIVHEVKKRIAGEYGPWKISRWDITTLAVADDLCFLEWIFEGGPGVQGASVEGASVVRCKDGKISYVREYITTQPLYEGRKE